MFRLTLAGLLVGCPSAPKGNGELVEDDENFVIDGESDALADADADGGCDADAMRTRMRTPMPMRTRIRTRIRTQTRMQMRTSSDTDTVWPYPGAYTAELTITGEWWGEWCVGSLDFDVTSEGDISSSGDCEIPEDDEPMGVDIEGSVDTSESVSGTAVLSLGSGAYDFELSGEHAETSDGMVFEFRTSGYQEHEVRMVRR